MATLQNPASPTQPSPSRSIVSQLWLQYFPEQTMMSDWIANSPCEYFDACLTAQPNTFSNNIQLFINNASNFNLTNSNTQDLIKFLEKITTSPILPLLKKAQWIGKSSKNGPTRNWTQYEWIYLLNALNRYYPANKTSKNTTSPDVAILDNVNLFMLNKGKLETLTRNVIAHPYLLSQAYADYLNLPSSLDNPQLFFRFLIGLADYENHAITIQEKEEAAALIAFFDTLRQTKSTIQLIESPQAKKYGTLPKKIAKLLGNHTKNSDALRILYRLSEQTTALKLAPLFNFITINDDFDHLGWSKFALAGHFWREIWSAHSLNARFTLPKFPLPEDWDIQVQSIAEANKMTLSEEQRNALKHLWINPFTVLTGHPGTGKTTVLGLFIILLNFYQKPTLPQISFLGMAPFGRSAKQLRIRTQHTNPPITPWNNNSIGTIHQQLAMSPYFLTQFRDKLDEELAQTLKGGALIVDEFSTLDINLIYNTLRVSTTWDATQRKLIPSPFRLIWSGDPYQIPPVDVGEPLEIIKYFDHYTHPNGLTPHVALTQNHRNKSNNSLKQNIPLLMKSVNHPANSWVWDDHTQFLSLTTIDDLGQQLENLTNSWNDELGHWQIITPVHKMRQWINQKFRENRFTQPSLFTIGDRIVYVRNNITLDLQNGSMGIIQALHNSDSPDPEITVLFDDGISRRLKTSDPLIYGWAITIHKSLGNEWDHVIVVVPSRQWLDNESFTLNADWSLTQFDKIMEPLTNDEDDENNDDNHTVKTGIAGMLDLRLPYTAISRAKSQLVIISDMDKDSLIHTFQTLPQKRRMTQLRNSLRFGKYALNWNVIPPSPPKPEAPDFDDVF